MTEMLIPPKDLKEPTADIPKILVNGVEIAAEKISQAVQYYPAESLDGAINQAAQNLVLQELMSQVSGQTVENEESVIAFIESQIQTETITDIDCQRYFDSNPEKFVTSPLLELRHILLMASHQDIEKRLEQQAVAKDLIVQLSDAENFDETFSTLATQYSSCPSKSEGGRLGQISAGQTVKEFERQVFPLNVGFCPNPIETRYGYHVVQVDNKEDGKPLEYTMCIDKIRDYLTERRHRQAISQYLHEQVEAADISGVRLQMEQENLFMG